MSRFARYKLIDFFKPVDLLEIRWVVSDTTLRHCSIEGADFVISICARNAWIGEESIVEAVVMKSVHA